MSGRMKQQEHQPQCACGMDRAGNFIKECGGEREGVVEALAMIDRLVAQVEEFKSFNDRVLFQIERRDAKIAEMSGRLFRSEGILKQLIKAMTE